MSEEKIDNFVDLLFNFDMQELENETKFLENYKKLQQENQQLKEKINTYENPEDLTLMFMYCDEKAKDKIKELKEIEKEHQKINGELREENELLTHRLKTANDFIESRKENLLPEHYDDLKYIINECDLNSGW